MNKKPLRSIGYDFIHPDYLPEGKNEYHLRNFQNRNGINYRNLSAYEIEVLVRNRNTSDDWNKIQVSDAFNPELVKNCKFFGLVRIGKLESIALEYHNLTMPVGLYDSTIISCDFGDNVIINNVNYMSHYIIGNEVMIANVNELHVTDHAKFGNGIIKDGEEEDIRIWLEVCNENGGRKILPFNGMLPGDAYLWSKYRNDTELLDRFKEFTEKKFDKQRGYYGKIGDNSVIKNTAIIKDVWVGNDAYIKGANKLKNLTINSSAEAPSQIGEGCELVNGIIGFGCRIFYGVKAVRFFMASHSQLKYGARLINSFLGNNATISCCEVLNSLIYPFHEQHHNNSFLIAATVMGQSNIAAGATLGSNHNSRAADGELLTGRGFWPGLCVSVKHNSRFATFTLIAKGDYPAELNIPMPFCLVSNDVASNKLVIMPAYWFLYNLYALTRNAAKYSDRDKRTKKLQHIEYNFLAPDSVNEIFIALDLLRKFTARAAKPELNSEKDELVLQEGDRLLNDKTFDVNKLAVYAEGFECTNRPTQIIKVKEAYGIYKKLVVYYAIEQILQLIQKNSISSFEALQEAMPKETQRTPWVNVGGQLFPLASLQSLLTNIKKGKVNSWNEMHQFYSESSKAYPSQKLQHAYASLLELLQLQPAGFTRELFLSLLDEALHFKAWMVDGIYASREKDYQNEFRKMVYDNEEEMAEVVGRLEDNSFIKKQQAELEQFKSFVDRIHQDFALQTA
jgi:signal peptidase I